MAKTATKLNISDKASPLYTPSHVANFFLDCAKEEGEDLTMLKLQKLVYFAYGWTLAVLGEELFNTTEHPIRRYRYGPVLESLYQEFKFLGNDPINFYSSGLDDPNDGFKTLRIDRNDENVRRVLARVWRLYRGLSGGDLVLLTHHAGSPWDKANHKGASVLDKTDIKKHFSDRFKRYHWQNYV